MLLCRERVGQRVGSDGTPKQEEEGGCACCEQCQCAERQRAACLLVGARNQ